MGVVFLLLELDIGTEYWILRYWAWFLGLDIGPAGFGVMDGLFGLIWDMDSGYIGTLGVGLGYWGFGHS